jgi:hypothetical protein
VEEEQVELADVGDEELVEAAGEHVAGLLVRACDSISQDTKHVHQSLQGMICSITVLLDGY